MRDWVTDINEYDMHVEESSIKAPSDSIDLKRKSREDSSDALTKKPRFESDVVVPEESDISSEPSLTSSPSPLLESDLNVSTSTSSSSSSSSSSESQEDEGSPEGEDEEFLPRRRGIQMWTSRQRWKDERKKVMKMSITKLAEIDDPELCLLRSVLINNTIKKLHSDIKNERQAKLRQRQQRMDYFAERFSSAMDAVSPEQFVSDYSCRSVVKPMNPTTAASTTDFYDDTSCDEMFGIGDDYLRVPVPDRRVSSPIPTSRTDSRDSDSTEPMDTTPSPVTTASVTFASYNSNTNNNTSLPSCDTAVDCSPPFYQSRRTAQQNNSQTVLSAPPAFPSSPPANRRLAGPVSSAATGGSQCATQYRTNRDLGGGDVSFPPRVPILDSVVYHSLLASLESS